MASSTRTRNTLPVSVPSRMHVFALFAYFLAVLTPLWKHYQRAESFPTWPDAQAIVARSTAVATGADLYQWPDAPLRYPPIAILIRLDPFGFTPETITLAYTILFIGVLIPASVYYLGREWFSPTIGAIAVLLLIPVNLKLFPRITPLWTQNGFWMYAYAIPPMLLGLYYASRADTQRDLLLAGVCLGVAAMLELFFAGIAAISIAVAYLATRRVKGLSIIAGTSIVTSLPLLPLLVRHNWLSHGSGRLVNGTVFTLTGILGQGWLAVTVFGLAAVAILAVLVFTADRELVVDIPGVLWAFVGLNLAGYVWALFAVPGWWYRIGFGYLLHFGMVLLGAVVLYRAVVFVMVEYSMQKTTHA